MSVGVKDLSPDQREAYDAIMRWMRGNGTRQPVLSLGGYAGTGKSTLVALIAEQVDLPAFCAYTGKATSVLRRKLAAAGTATVGTQKRDRDGEMSKEDRPYCGTIHSLIYRPCDCLTPQTVEIRKPCPTCGEELRSIIVGATAKVAAACASKHTTDRTTFDALKPKTRFVHVEKDEHGRCKLCHGKEWLRREELDRDYSLIIVDEASMVDDMLLRDLQGYGVPILAVGDHGQLPPVSGSGSLMRNPHLRLEQIHRQAEGSPIIALSKIIRETGRIPDSMPESEAVRFGRIRLLERIIEERYGDASAERLLEMGLACYTNKRRVGLNVAVRRARGTARTGRELPRVGEHVVCLRNIKEGRGRPPVANGMRGVLQSDVAWKLIRDPHGKLTTPSGDPASESGTQLIGSIAFPEDEIGALDYEMFAPQFGRERTFGTPEELARETGIHSFSMAGALFDFGWALTAHKCVAPDTLVETPGGLVRAGELAPAGRIATPSGSAIYRNFVRNPSGPMLQITTEDGYELRVTPDHGVDVWSVDDGYVRREAKSVKAGDIVRLRLGAEFKTGSEVALPAARPQDVRARKYNLPRKCTAEVAEFLGLMVADGTVYGRKGFRLAKRHKDAADRFDALCRRLFGATPSRFFRLGAHHVEVNSRLIADWLTDIGGMEPNAKNVPECILAAPIGVQARFLRGLFEDGTVNVKDGVLDHIEFISTVAEVRRTVRTMLLRFEIVAGMTPSRPASIYLYGQHAKRFGNRIGFVSQFKQSRLKSSRVPKGTRYVFPLYRDELRRLGRSETVIQRHRAPRVGFESRTPFHHSTVRDVARYSGESVCVEVPDGHQFVQDGFCGWNCQGSQFDDFVAIIERPGPVDADTWRRWQYTVATRAISKLTVLR